jgi:hypothetical protein
MMFGDVHRSFQLEAIELMDNPQSNTEALALARRFFSERYRIWARPMVNVLENLRPKLALRWAILVFQESLSRRRKSGSESQQRTWLEELTALLERDDVADYCGKVAYEVWHNDAALNLVERGIARLYWAMENYLRNRVEDYHRQVASAVGMLADNENTADDMDEPTLERAVALFSMIQDRITRGELGA